MGFLTVWAMLGSIWVSLSWTRLGCDWALAELDRSELGQAVTPGLGSGWDGSP